MNKQINFRCSEGDAAVIDVLKEYYQTDSTTDIIKYALISACHELGVDYVDIFNSAYKKED